ncbi:MAG TPA: ABC transporter permease [Pseudonocardiaceae bacterium]|nr:ABC transporter permease [Pseudonocardiaceae bacterium]
MITFILRRVISAVLMLIVVSMVTFVIFFVVPKLGGQTTDQLAASFVGKSPSLDALHAIEDRLGLNLPVYQQYWNFIKAIVAGEDYSTGTQIVHCPAPCFGYSFKNQLPVWPQMTAALPVTLSLAIGAAILWLVGGVGVGVVSALRRGSLFDRASMTAALAGVSLPVFFTALLTLAWFQSDIPIFTTAGTYIPLTQNPIQWAYALILPWVTLAFLYAALYARLTRAGMLDTMGEDFIRTARAKGLPERRVVFKHGLRATLSPILTIFGLDLGLLLGGAVLTETAFSLPGLGHFAYSAIQSKDLPEIMGVTLLAGFFVVVANLIVDILYAVVDPRVRYS